MAAFIPESSFSFTRLVASTRWLTSRVRAVSVFDRPDEVEFVCGQVLEGVLSPSKFCCALVYPDTSVFLHGRNQVWYELIFEKVAGYFVQYPAVEVPAWEGGGHAAGGMPALRRGAYILGLSPFRADAVWQHLDAAVLTHEQTGEAGDRRSGGFAVVRCGHDCGSLFSLGCRWAKCPVLLCSLD